MDKKSCKLDYWRNYFHNADFDILEVIENAILVAAADCAEEFQNRRDRITENLFSSHLTRCSGCDCIELSVPHKEEEAGFRGGFRGNRGERESKVNSSIDDHGELTSQKWVSNCTFDEVEALEKEIEEETEIVREVTRIKKVLGNKDESEGEFFVSLRKLQLMGLTVEILQATEIGKAVNVLLKHRSKKMRHLSRALIMEWRDTVDDWVNSAAAIASISRSTAKSVNPSVVEEEGLPSPPLDDGVFFSAQTTSMELSRFFDGMGDDGNPQNTGEFDKNRENGTEPVSDDYDHKRKLEVTGRNLQDRYQQVENAKKRREVQAMELRDLPKQRPSQRNSHVKPGMHRGQWENGRRRFWS